MCTSDWVATTLYSYDVQGRMVPTDYKSHCLHKREEDLENERLWNNMLSHEGPMW